MIIELTPNLELFIKFIFWIYLLKAVLYIITGSFKIEKQKDTHYGVGEIVSGIVRIIIVLVILLI